MSFYERAGAAPVHQSERIIILDALRGIALLGILLMNITGFALPAPASYGDLVVMNELGTINEKTWFIIDWIFEGSQRALFSMLFGAGIILFISRQEKREGGLLPADYFFRRQVWLLFFGLGKCLYTLVVLGYTFCLFLLRTKFRNLKLLFTNPRSALERFLEQNYFSLKNFRV